MVSSIWPLIRVNVDLVAVGQVVERLVAVAVLEEIHEVLRLVARRDRVEEIAHRLEEPALEELIDAHFAVASTERVESGERGFVAVEAVVVHVHRHVSSLRMLGASSTTTPFSSFATSSSSGTLRIEQGLFVEVGIQPVLELIEPVRHRDGRLRGEIGAQQHARLERLELHRVPRFRARLAERTAFAPMRDLADAVSERPPEDLLQGGDLKARGARFGFAVDRAHETLPARLATDVAGRASARRAASRCTVGVGKRLDLLRWATLRCVNAKRELARRRERRRTLPQQKTFPPASAPPTCCTPLSRCRMKSCSGRLPRRPSSHLARLSRLYARCRLRSAAGLDSARETRTKDVINLSASCQSVFCGEACRTAIDDFAARAAAAARIRTQFVRIGGHPLHRSGKSRRNSYLARAYSPPPEKASTSPR